MWGSDGSSAIGTQQISDVEIGQHLQSDKDTSMNDEETGPIPGSSSPKLDMVDAEIDDNACQNVSKPLELTVNAADGRIFIPTIDQMDSRAVVDKGTGDGKSEKQVSDEFVFEPGSIFVEFPRKEAACTAARSLLGRTYGERTVTAGFFPYNKYTARFHGSNQS